MLGSLFSFSGHRERWLSPQRRLLEKYLTTISGFYTAQAYGVLALKLMSLALGGLIVWGVLQAKEEGTTEFVFALLLLAPCSLPFAWLGLFTYTGLVLERLNPRSRFRRVRRAARLPQRTDAPTIEEPGQGEETGMALRSSPRGQLGVHLRAGLFLLLGVPAVLLLGYCLLAYLHGFWTWVEHFPTGGFVSWDEPVHLSGIGERFFAEEHVKGTVLAMTVSLIALCWGGVALARLSVPLLTRRGAEAIDLALTSSGVLVRGGLEIGWDEISEVLVVRDLRIGAAVTSSAGKEFAGPGLTFHPTYTSSHSRTRLALVLHDLEAVADRASRVAPPRHRSLRTDRTGTYGYALCDLWSHSHQDVADALEPLSARARERGVPVTDLRRIVHWDHLDLGPEWLGVMLTWR